MKKNLYYLLYIGVLMMFLACCQDEGMFTPEENDTPVSLSYTVRVGEDAESRAIGDGSKVDELIVGVFQNGTQIKQYTYEVKVEQENVINIPLLRNETYDLVFWAQKSGNAIYDTEDLSDIGIDYSQYADISLVETEDFEAFSLVLKEVSVDQPGDADLVLTRPFAQLNIAASEADIFDNVDATRFTISKVYTSYNPFSGPVGELVEQEFSFKYADDAPQSTTIDGNTYYYLASAYLLAPAKVDMIGGLYKDNEEYKTFSFNELPLAANARTNIYGDMIQQEEMQGWDGIIPIENPLTQDEENRYIIDQEIDLAWLSQNASSLAENSTFLVEKDVLNMGGYPISSIQLPQGSIFDGNWKAIKNFANSLFGYAASLTVQNLTLDNVVATVEEGHVGVLVNTLTGSSTFTGVTITNSSATTINGVAGGMVGKIVRKDETSREEELTVTFSNCDLTNVTVNGTESEGKFVGLFSGYDNLETLSFDAECSAENTHVTDYTSSYKAENQSVWQTPIENTYDTWLGTETYRRGVVKFADIRLVPKWDGEHAVEPIAIADNCYEVYSPFDLAGVRAKTASPTAIYLKTDIDMNGQGADGKFNVPSNFAQSAYTSTDDNVFEPFSSVTTLDGTKSDMENYSIYNLSISEIGEEKAAFILSASGTTTHKNINFQNCQTVAVHKEVETDAKAYGAILVSNVEATYTMENVHAYDCRVFALQKVGTLGARIAGTSTLLNNSVNNCYVENYECNIPENFESGWKDIDVEFKVYTVNCYSSFFPHGEIGGMFGFIQGNSNISNCHVNKIKINAFGQNDKEADFDIKDMDGWKEAGLIVLAKTFTGLYLVPGRHVGTLIGDIRATGTITITDSGVTDSQCLNRQDKHNDTYDYLGQCYYVKFLDSEGSVTVDGNKLTLANCNRNTKR